MSSTTPARTSQCLSVRPRWQRSVASVAATAVAVVGLGLAGAPPAAAAPIYGNFYATYSTGGSGDADLAVDPGTGVVYSTTAGALQAASWITNGANGGPNGSGDVNQAAASAGAGYDEVAVAASAGKVFAADNASRTLKMYAVATDVTTSALNTFAQQTGTAVSLPGATTGNPGDMVVDDVTKTLWVAFPGDASVAAYDITAGTWSAPVALGGTVGRIDVDTTRHVLYAAMASSVKAVSASGNSVSRTFSWGGVTRVDDVAVDSRTGNLFTAQPSNNRVQVSTTAGADIATFTSSDNTVTQPSNLVVNPAQGMLYVTYLGNRRVMSAVDVADPGTATPERRTSSGYTGGGAGADSHPGLAVDVRRGQVFGARGGGMAVGFITPLWSGARANNVTTKAYNAEHRPMEVVSTSVPQATGGQAYSAQVLQRLGLATGMAMVDPPPGLAMDPGGLITGVPMEAGDFNVAAIGSYMNVSSDLVGYQMISGGNGQPNRTNEPGTVSLRVTVAPPVISTSQVLPAMSQGVAYSQQVTSTFMDASHYPSGWVNPQWSVVPANSLPPGLTLSATGVIAGQPTAAGQYTFTVKAQNSAGSDTRQYTVNVGVVAPTITTDNTFPLGDGEVGTPYQDQSVFPSRDFQFAATGTAPISWSVASGNLPTGLTLASDGKLTGSPTAVGTYTFTVQATGAANPPATRTFVINVPFTAVQGGATPRYYLTEGVPFSVQLPAPQGTAPITWDSIRPGGWNDALPSGMTISQTGLLSGTPAAGSSTAVSNQNGGTGRYTVTWKVTNVDPANPSSPADANMDVQLSVGAVAPVLSAVAGNGSATLTFPSLGGSWTDYVWTDDNFNNSYHSIYGGGGSPPAAGQTITVPVTGLTNGQPYTFQVMAQDSNGGSSGGSNRVTVTPAAPMAGPSSATATATGGATPSIGLSFPPASGSPTGYGVILNGGPVQTLTTSGSSTLTASLTSYNGQAITNGTAYVVQVVATNGGSQSSPVSAGTVTPADTAPGQVSLTSTSGTNNGVVVTFPAPTNTGSAIIKYEYTLDNGANWAQLSTSGPGPYTGTIGSLQNGTAYSVKVRAFNTLPGAASAPGTATANPGPGAVTGLTSTAGNASASLSFTAPSTGAAVTGYQYSLDGTNWLTLNTSGSAPVTATVSTGLNNGTSYTFRVRATSANGIGTAVAAMPVTPDVAPGQVTLTSITGTSGGAQVTFPAPTNTGSAITRYEYTTDAGSTWTSLGYTGSGPYTGTISGTSAAPGTPLTNGTAYSVQVRAFNTLPGAASTSAAVTPNPVPGAVTGLSSTAGNGSVALSFTAPSTGAPVTGYQYSTNGGQSWQTLTTSGSAPVTGTVTGLPNGQGASVMVRATSANGPGASATAPVVVPNTPPPAPGAVTATPGNGGATLSFAAPTGGTASTVTGYRYSTNGGTSWQTLTVTSGAGVSPVTGSITGLTNGTASSVIVQAVSPQGTSSSTSPVSVTPVGAPGAATAGSVTSTSTAGGAASIGLSFTPPTSTPANPVTGYAVSINGGPYQPITTTGSSPLTASLTSNTGQPLVNGTTYQVNVVALNAGGQSTVLNAGTVVPNVAPGAVAISSVTPVAGGGGATVVFPAAVTNGGSPVTGYQYQVGGTGSWVTLPTSGSAPVTGTVTGLPNGSASAITVRAVNSTMQGPASASASVTPYAPPAAPGAVTATAGNASVAISFPPAASTAQAPVTGYLYSTTGPTGPWVPLPATAGSNPLTTTLTALSTGAPIVNGQAVTVYLQATGSGGTSTVVTSNAVTPAPTAPTVPLNLSVTAAAAALDLSFFAPATDGGSAITKYQYSTDGTTWADLTIVTTLSSGGMTARITTVTAAGNAALANGQAYSVRVRAVNAVGSSPATSAASGTPVALPGAPQLMSVAPSNGQAQIAFVHNPNNPAGTTYQVSTNGANGPWTTLTTTAGTGAQTGQLISTVSGLTNGSPVTFTLQAVAPSSLTSQPVSAPAVTPNQLPAAPTGVTATSLPTGATLSFTAPAGNAPLGVTGYGVIVNGTGSPLPLVVTSAPGASPVTGTVAGLVNGTAASLTVVALAPQGSSPASSPAVSVTPYGIPAAPASLTTTVGNTQLGLSFPAVTSTPGTPVTGYQYSLNGAAGPWLTVVPTSAPGASPVTTTVTGLTNGTGYAVQVRSVNTLVTPAIASTSGTGSSPVTTAPGAVPDAPVALVASGVSAAAVLTFAEPVNAGSSPITGYEASVDGGQTWTALTTAPTAGTPGPYTATLGSLTNGTTYTVLVHAVNAVGSGLAATAVGIPGGGTPSAPRNLVLTPGVGTATATFIPPATTGGAPITGYAYQVGGSGPWLPLTVTVGAGGTLTGSIPGLTGGQVSSIAISAVTASGLTPPAGAAVTGTVTATSAPVPNSGGGSGGGSGAGGGSTPTPSPSPSPSGSGSSLPPLAPGTVPPAGQAAPPVMVAPGTIRIAGPTRLQTATALSTALWPSAQTVPALVVMSSDVAADGIAGSRLAQAVGGPMLLTAPGSLSADTKAEIARVLMNGGRVYVLGGENAVSARVFDQIDDLPGNPSVVRLAGADRYETSVKIAQAVDGMGKSSGTVYVGAGTDAAMTAPLAARTGGVVLLTQDGKLPSSVAGYLAGKQTVVAIGGPAARSLPSAASVVGSDRYDTSSKVASAYTSATGAAPTVFAVANGENWPDQVTGGASMALLGGPLLLTQPSELNGNARGTITRMGSLKASVVVGGTQAVSPNVETSLRSMGF